MFAGKAIVNSGAMWMSSKGFEAVGVAMQAGCPMGDSHFHGIDQVVVNWLVHSGKLKHLGFQIEQQPRGRSIVNNLHYVWPKIQLCEFGDNATDPSAYQTWPQVPAWIFRNPDGTASGVVHQFDGEKTMVHSLNTAAARYIERRYPRCRSNPPGPTVCER